jgi:hypothetical protein
MARGAPAGRDLADAIEFAMELGPAGEMMSSTWFIQATNPG